MKAPPDSARLWTQMEVNYSLGKKKADNQPAQRVAGSFADFAIAVLAARSDVKGKLYVCGPFAPADDTPFHRERGVVNKSHRCARCARERRFIGLDVDHFPSTEAYALFCQLCAKWSAIVYNTASHTPADPRARAIIEVDRPMARAECMAASTALRNRIVAEIGQGFEFDVCLDRPEQPIFTPTTGAWSVVHEGAVLSVDELLAESPVPLKQVERPYEPSNGLGDLRPALEFIAGTDRDTWLAVGMAIHSTAAPEAFDIWNEWAAKWPKHDGVDQRRVWNSFSLNPQGLKLPTVFKLAMDAGWPNPRSTKNDPRARVVVRAGYIHEVADAFESAMIASRQPIFARGEVLVRYGIADPQKHVRRDTRAPVLVQATPPMLREIAERSCRFVRESINHETGEPRTQTIDCPGSLPTVYLGRVGEWGVPHVVGIAEAPILREDGTIVSEGYDADSQVLIAAPGQWLDVRQRPTVSDAKIACARLEALLSGFSFVAPEDRSMTLAAMLTAIARPTLRAAPAFGWSAPVRGSGKSKLADVVAVIATGRTAAAIAWADTEEESEKRIGAAVLAGDPVLLIDNIEIPVRSQILNSMLTQEAVAIRILGKSQMPRVAARALLLLTGNNLIISGDLTRRVLVSEIDPGVERPEERAFTFDPVELARAQRRELVVACLTILRYGLLVPSQAPPLGSFEQWSRRVRDPLMALGYADPCLGLARLAAADPERELALELLTAWQDCFGATPTTVRVAIHEAESRRDGSLYEAIVGVAGGPGGLNSRRLGKYLLRIKDRIYGSLLIRQGIDRRTCNSTWATEVNRGAMREAA